MNCHNCVHIINNIYNLTYNILIIGYKMNMEKQLDLEMISMKTLIR